MGGVHSIHNVPWEWNLQAKGPCVSIVSDYLELKYYKHSSSF